MTQQAVGYHRSKIVAFDCGMGLGRIASHDHVVVGGRTRIHRLHDLQHHRASNR